MRQPKADDKEGARVAERVAARQRKEGKTCRRLQIEVKCFRDARPTSCFGARMISGTTERLGPRFAYFCPVQRLAIQVLKTIDLNDTGTAVKRNRQQAVYWYKRAYRHGNAAGASNIGTILRDEGKTGQALLWFQRAVDWGTRTPT